MRVAELVLKIVVAKSQLPRGPAEKWKMREADQASEIVFYKVAK